MVMTMIVAMAVTVMPVPMITAVGVNMVVPVVVAMRVCPAMRFGRVVVMRVIGAGRVIMVMPVPVPVPVPVIMILMIMVVLMRGIVGHGCTAKKERKISFRRFRVESPVTRPLL